MSPERFKTIKRGGHSSLTEKKSVFIGDAVHISSEDEAKKFIEEKRKSYRDARHVVFAYTVGNVVRFSDDGEPQGTAGSPLLDVIKKNELSNVLITVVRIFGGILLGAGGLTRMYSSAASSAISDADIAFFEPYTEYKISVPYGEYGKLVYEIEAGGGRVLSSSFAENVDIFFSVPSRNGSILVSRINSVTNGKIVPKTEREYFDEAYLSFGEK